MLLTRQPAEGRSLSSVASCTAWWPLWMGHATCWETEMKEPQENRCFFWVTNSLFKPCESTPWYGGFLSHGGSPNPAWVEDGPYGFVWFPYYQGLVHVLIHHHPTIGDTYTFSSDVQTPPKRDIYPPVNEIDPAKYTRWKISFHQTWFIFTLYSNLPAYQPLMILSKSIDLSAPVSTADAIAATTRSGARGLEKPSRVPGKQKCEPKGKWIPTGYD